MAGAAGLEVNDEELPDHLCVVCEFGASGDVDVAWRLLTEHRAGIELLRLALTDRKSPWLDGVLGLLATTKAVLRSQRRTTGPRRPPPWITRRRA